jgi:hypothetical protein
MSGRVTFALLLFLCCAVRGGQGQEPRCAVRATERMEVVGDAPIVALKLLRADGTLRPARFVFDSGGGAIILDETLASDLGLKPTGKPIEDEGSGFSPVSAPKAYLGAKPISLSTSKAFVHLGKRSFDTRERVEGLLPGKALEPYDIVLDYPASRFSIASAGCVKHRGVKASSPFLPGSGHPQIAVAIGSNGYSLLLDTGSRVTLARHDLLAALSAAHPTWPRALGASGNADMPGGSGQEFMLRVPELSWGSLVVRNVLLVSRPDATYSANKFETPGPISGALGGNVLKNFRVEIDYPDDATYLEQKTSDPGADMHSVGLVLDISATGALVVVGISSTAAAVTKSNIRSGDQILEIAGKRGSPWTIIQASDALSGAVGESKQVLIRRGGRAIRTSAVVAALL